MDVLLLFTLPPAVARSFPHHVLHDGGRGPDGVDAFRAFATGSQTHLFEVALHLRVRNHRAETRYVAGLGYGSSASRMLRNSTFISLPGWTCSPTGAAPENFGSEYSTSFWPLIQT